MKKLYVVLALACIAGCQSNPEKTAAVPAAPVVSKYPMTLEDAVSSSTYRQEASKARDQYRHPVETLTFFGLKPDMNVVEVVPGNGWYTEILAPYLKPHGHYTASYSPEGDHHKVDKTWIDTAPTDMITRTIFDPANEMDIAPEGSADLVLTFRNVHNWIEKGADQAAFNAFFKALKPGGTLGVVEHRASKKMKDTKGKMGYVREDYVINLAKKAGFKLEAKSEINANPKDKKNYKEGVWTLPPTLKLGDKDREKYLAIGESDRMTLKFVKPAKM